MTMRVKILFLTLALTAGAVAPVAEAANPPTVNQDLAAVIALNGQPCGQVVSVQRLGDNDYIASCSNGSRYRVFVKEGRVTVQKQ